LNQYFFDSSALVKRYVAEPGTLWLLELLTARARYAPLVAQIAQVEICSSVMRRAREGTLSQQEARLTRLFIDFDMAREYRVIALTGDVVALAEDLRERHALRASDAIQLASALPK
jgi:predicted nucleic acid-binding protein